MCGPIAFMLPVEQNNSVKKITQISFYHIGRLLAYSIIGIVFGLVGKSLYIFGFQQKLSIFIGILMILIVIIPSRAFNNYHLSKPIYQIISKVKSTLGSTLKKKSMDAFLTIGFLNGFLPCGLVYMALIGAIALANTTTGALYMLVFGLGTIPLMSIAVYARHWLPHNSRRTIQKIVPFVIVLIGLCFILRGMGIGIPFLSPGPVKNLATSSLHCH